MTTRVFMPFENIASEVTGASLSDEKTALMNGIVALEPAPATAKKSQFYTLAVTRNAPWTGDNTGEAYTGDDNEDSLDGAGGNDTLKGAGGNDTLRGGTGTDRLEGGADDDTYYVDHLDTVIEEAGKGYDTVIVTGGTFTLALNSEVEELQAESGSSPIGIIGNNLKNKIIGNDGANGLDGGGGGDTLIGGDGDDMYTLRNEGDVIIEKTGQGKDSVIVTFDYTLKDYSDAAETEVLEIEKLYAASDLTYDKADIDLTGNSLANELYGNSGANILNGGLGADTMSGSSGNDIYHVDNEGDVVIEYTSSLNSYRDMVYVLGKKFILGQDSAVEELYANRTGPDNGVEIRGSKYSNSIYGGNGNDTIHGDDNLTLSDADYFEGKDGDDTYYVDFMGDVVIEGNSTNSGTDTVVSEMGVIAAGSYANVEIFKAAEKAGAATLISTGAAQKLIGNSSGNSLISGGGSDTLEGGLGDDSYVINILDLNNGEKVTLVEYAGEGRDTLTTSVDFILEDGVEIEVIRAGNETVVSLTGNNFANEITGNTIGNILDGGAGADILTGGKGDDKYLVDNAGDMIIEFAGEGNDTIVASNSYVLGAGISVENIEAVSGKSNINLTGNNIANKIKGNAGNNRLDGGGGADILEGGDGDDTYVIDNDDTIIETSTGGFDMVVVSVSTELSKFSNIEALKAADGTQNINLTGDLNRNKLIGNDGDNALDGGAGADTLRGGAGNDTYYVDDKDDLIVEAGGDGSDKIITSASYAISDAMEIETLEAVGGTVHINLTGNNLANTITGNNGNNVLNGGLGADILIGGKGDDTYIVDNAGDVVIEDLKDEGGNDKIVTSVSIALAESQFIEIMEAAAGTTAVNLTGNSSGNVLTGNNGDNVLEGKSGDDTLDGKGGVNTAVFTGSRSQYTITKHADGSYTIADKVADRDGSDTLTNIQFVRFSDDIVDLQTLPELSIEAKDAIKAEGDSGTTLYTFTITRSNDLGTASVGWKVVSNDMGDFLSSSLTGTVDFAEGEPSKTITVSVKGDKAVESNKEFSVELYNPSGATIAAGNGSASGLILNDDTQQVLSISAEQAAESEGASGTTTFTYKVTRDTTDGALTVAWKVEGFGENAAEASDFVLTGGNVVFEDGQSSATITLLVKGDAFFEQNENFVVKLGAVTSGAAVVSASNGSATGTIINDDAAIPDNAAPSNIHVGSGGTIAFVDENRTGDYVVATVKADDDGGSAGLRYSLNSEIFEIDDAGNIRVKNGASLNYELRSSYTVTVMVTDLHGNGLSAASDITINVNDVNERAKDLIFTDASQMLKVGTSGTGAAVTLATASDLDGADSGFATNLYRFDTGTGTSSDGLFFINANTGEITTTRAVTAADVGTRTLNVVAYDAANPSLTYVKAHTVTILAADNDAPEGIVLSKTAVDEKSQAGTLVATLSGLDPQGGNDIASFSIELDPDSKFEIVGNELRVRTGAVLDHEAKSSHLVKIRITDKSGVSTVKDVTIGVNDINERPVDITFTGGHDLKVGETGMGASVVFAKAEDRDTSTSDFANNRYCFDNYTGTSTDGLFVINAFTGEITTTRAITKSDVGFKTLNIVTYDATNSALYEVRSYTVKIVTADNVQPYNVHLVGGETTAFADEHRAGGYVVGTVTAEDDDGEATDLRYSLTSDTFKIDAVTGRIQIKDSVILDYEDQSTYTLKVIVTDLKGAGKSVEQDITIHVNDQTDVWRGGKGKDTLAGTAGRDIFYGNSGNDILAGGGGQNIFVFNSKLGTSNTDRKVNFDKIIGYNTVLDSIYLDNAIFKKIGKGSASSPRQLSKSNFVIGSKAKDEKDYVIYNNKTGILSYDADGSDSKYQQIEFAQFSRNTKISHKELFIV